MIDLTKVWVEDRKWQLLQYSERRKCRMTSCRNIAVAKLFRKGRRRSSWWCYCQDHLFGKRIENGRVMVEVYAESTLGKNEDS